MRQGLRNSISFYFNSGTARPGFKPGGLLHRLIRGRLAASQKSGRANSAIVGATTIFRLDNNYSVLSHNYALFFFFAICDISDFRVRHPPAIQGQHSLVSAAICGQHPLLPPAIQGYNWVEIGHFGAQP